MRDRALGIIAVGVVLTLLYFGREVLIPLTLALMLSLLIAPLVHAMRRVGLGQTFSVLAAVLALALACTAIAVVLGIQILRMASSLPQYQLTIQQKLHSLDELTVGRLNALTTEASRFIDSQVTTPLPGVTPLPHPSANPVTNPPQWLSPIPVELHEPRTGPLQIVGRVLGSVWGPIETTGIVLVVLVFVLLEHESLRDRFIRIAGGTDIRRTTLALNDAAERLSRFFVSQFAVNLGVGGAIALGLAILGVPNAVLWATLAAVLRFVPYVGVWIAAMFSTALALAVVPGWSLAAATLGLFILVEVVAGQVVEPQLYGHTTGLSPLSVVVAAIFWSSLWGPVGLILSTPLTLCLLVGGRHVKGLRVLDLLLGDAQALTMPQKFYQRALSGDSHEIIANARAFLKRNSLATYCDLVLMPALRLGSFDFERGVIGEEQQLKIREVIVTVVSALGGQNVRSLRRPQRASVLAGTSSGQTLRQERERLTGRWQGPVVVPPGSVIVCLGLGAAGDDLAAELLVRILHNHELDARHFSVEDAGPPPGATAGAVAIIYLVSANPGAVQERSQVVGERVRQLFPKAFLVHFFVLGEAEQSEPGQARAQLPATGHADQVVTSFADAVRICVDWRQQRAAS